MFENGLPLLSLMIITLPIGAVLLWLVPNPLHARAIALAVAVIDLVLALATLARFDTRVTGFQMLERAEWIPSLNIQYLVGVDGISVLFLPFTVLLCIGVILASWHQVRSLVRLYYTLLLLLESVTLGIFCALDTILFFLFWELTLIPLYFLISLWGMGPNRRYAAVKYILFMLAGGIPLLYGFILLAINHAQVAGAGLPAGLAFDLPTLLATPLAASLEATVFFLLLLGFLVKTPAFPLHTWLPVVAMEGPTGVAAIMTGLKLGVFGLIRFTLPLAPQAAQDYHWLLAGLGVIGVLYGALAAFSQTNLRRMLAYSSISHVGLVLLGIASFNLQGLQGALFQLLNFALIAGGLFLLTGFLHHRTGSTDLISLGGVARSMPLLAALFFFFGIASLGIPGTSGFIGEFLLLYSALSTHTGAGLAALLGVVLSAAYFLGYYRRAFLGPLQRPVIAEACDLERRELLIAAVLGALILAFGLHPSLILDITQGSSELWLQRLQTP